MLIERTRINPSPTELAALYQHANDADRWPEHTVRVDVTVAVARARFPDRDLIVDPAAGAGRTARELAVGRTITGDVAPDAPVDHPGVWADILLAQLAEDRVVADLVILGEILEHVRNPADLLVDAAHIGRGLVLSTPLEEADGVNPEHLWRWDAGGVRYLLSAAGWEPVDYVELDYRIPAEVWPHPFRCQINTARRTS